MTMIKNEFESVTTVLLFAFTIYYCSSFKIDSLIRLFPRPLINIVVSPNAVTRSELPSMKTEKNDLFYVEIYITMSICTGAGKSPSNVRALIVF